LSTALVGASRRDFLKDGLLGAGATFSCDGEWLFLDIYSAGVTVTITGPWQDGCV
jgi:hypothetical protein